MFKTSLWGTNWTLLFTVTPTVGHWRAIASSFCQPESKPADITMFLILEKK